MECQWNKSVVLANHHFKSFFLLRTIKICGCAPKMLHLPEFEICTKKGINSKKTYVVKHKSKSGKTCWEKNENILNDEEKDKCNCKYDIQPF